MILGPLHKGFTIKFTIKEKKKFTIKDTWTLITELGVQNAMIDTKHEVPPEARKIGHLHFMEICVGFM